MSQSRSGQLGPPYLLVQAQELAVAHPAVQHPVHVDVVGLQGRAQSEPSQIPGRSQHLPGGAIPGSAQLAAHRMPGSTQEKAIS